MLDLLSIALIGVLTGVFTGLVPGIHPNTVIFGSLPLYLGTNFGIMPYAAFISGLSVSHTFHDFLPAIYMQAPDANTALSTMPGAEKAANGKGPEAFHSTLLGGIISISIFILILPILFLHLKSIYTAVEPFMGFLVGFFLLFLIFREESWAAVKTSILAGSLGFITLNSNLGGNFILMPLFSGLFAIPGITTSLQDDYNLPDQQISGNFTGLKGSFTGLASGLIAGIIPGVGAAASTSFLSPIMDDEDDFLAGMGGVNTTDIVTSLVALFTIGNARSGASVALQSLVKPSRSEIFLLIGISIFCAGISALLALRTEKFFLWFVEKVNFQRVGKGIMIVIVGITVLLSGFFGLLALLTASSIGYYSLVKGCRGCCMAVLLFPALIFFI